MEKSQPAEIAWHATGAPLSRRFDDPYFSLEDGWAESAYVFVAGNDLPARLAPGFQVAELGFGTGLNLLALQAAMAAAGVNAPVRFTSFEAFPLSAAETDQALRAFPAAQALAAPLLAARAAGLTRWQQGPIAVELVIGDARATVAAWAGRADAWFLDGFAPAKNPELWAPALLEELGRHTAPGGSFATYTAAGEVRRALGAAGFEVTRVKGFGRKRHMSVGRKP